MDGLCKGVNGVRASGPNYPPFSGRSKLAAPKLGKSTLVGNRNHLPDQVSLEDPDPEEFV